MINLNTFSIAARCPATGMLGVAVSTALPAVGGLCAFVKAGVGAIASQSWVNPYLGIDGLTLLESGLSAQEALDTLLAEDPGRTMRQVGIVDAQGRTAASTGSDCVSWAGHRIGDGFTIQGNMLVNEATVDAMADAATTSLALPFHERLMRVLEAGQAAGGDKRGKQSAALKIFNKEEFAWLDIRVDEHPDPVVELRRIVEVAKHQLLPIMDGMPSRGNPMGSISPTLITMLLTPPSFRPGGGAGSTTFDKDVRKSPKIKRAS